jgi:peptide/nickel transport system permease protein
MTAVTYSLRLALLATAIGFVLGSLFGFVAGYFRNSIIDRLASVLSVLASACRTTGWGCCWSSSSASNSAAGHRRRADRRGGLAVGLGAPAVHAAAGLTLSVIPTGIIARTALAGGGHSQPGVYRRPARPRAQRVAHLCPRGEKRRATALAVMGLQVGYLMGGSILVETVFSWPGTGLLLNTAIFQRDLPLLQGTIWVLALFFVLLNLLVDILQTTLDPRIKRS